MVYLARRWLGYDPSQWFALAWWTRKAMTAGMLWELERGGVFAEHAHGGTGSGGGGGRREYTPLDNASQESLAAMGISTS